MIVHTAGLPGQPAGDALGGLIEFQLSEQVRRDYAGRVRELVKGGTWNNIAGQSTKKTLSHFKS